MKYFLCIFYIFLISCNTQEKNIYNEKQNLFNIIEAYIFLSETHDLLHIIMGEHEGLPKTAYIKYTMGPSVKII